VSLSLAIVALGGYLPTYGTSSILGLPGLLFAIPGLRARDRRRLFAWVAIPLNAVLLATFVWIMVAYGVV